MAAAIHAGSVQDCPRSWSYGPVVAPEESNEDGLCKVCHTLPSTRLRGMVRLRPVPIARWLGFGSDGFPYGVNSSALAATCWMGLKDRFATWLRVNRVDCPLLRVHCNVRPQGMDLAREEHPLGSLWKY